MDPQEIIDLGDYSNGSSSSSDSPKIPIPIIGELENNNFDRLNQDGKEFKEVVGTFSSGFGVISVFVNIHSVYKSKFNTTAMNDYIFEQVGVRLGIRRGEAISQELAFVGGSLPQLIDLITHGFHGKGSISLSRPHYSCDSAKASPADSRGLFHVLACRVHVGRTHVFLPYDDIPTCPPSPLIDLGVTDREFLCFDNHKNSYVLPAYIISFGGAIYQGIHARVRGFAFRHAPHKILAALLDVLHYFPAYSKQMHMLRHSVTNYQNGYLTCGELIDRIRNVNPTIATSVFQAYFLPLTRMCTPFSTARQQLVAALSTLT